MTTTRKPRLTRAMADRLLSLADYASAEADEMYNGSADQAEFADEINQTCEWITQLANWKLNQAQP